MTARRVPATAIRQPEVTGPVRVRVPDVVLPLVVGAAAVAVFLLVRRAFIDDAYITMTYARNLAFHLHWGLIGDETANSATSPLNVIALAAITVVVRDPVIAVGVLFVVCTVTAARWLSSLADMLGASRVTPYLGTALLLLNPLLLSTVGLESYLGAALIIGLVHFGAQGRSVGFGVIGGLAFLTRPDLAVFVIVGALLFPGVRRDVVRALGAAALVAGPWHLWSWFALGSALPDTLIMKAGQTTWAGFGFWDGWLLYRGATPAVAIVSFLPVVLGGIALLVVPASRLAGRTAAVHRAAAVAGLGAVAHYLAYSILSPPPYHWYYAPLISGMTVCVALVIGDLVAPGGDRWLRPAGVASAVAAVALLVGMATLDIGHGTPWDRAPISTNWATTAQYERIGTDLRELVGSGVVESPGEIGALAYYCDCTIVDAFSDRGRVLGAIQAREARSGPIGRTLIGLNYVHLDRNQLPRPTEYRLLYERGAVPFGPRQWPVYQWAEGPGRMVLLPSGG